jgi:hypothetical protein
VNRPPFRMIAETAPLRRPVCLNDPLYVIRAAYDTKPTAIALPQAGVVIVVGTVRLNRLAR